MPRLLELNEGRSDPTKGPREFRADDRSPKRSGGLSLLHVLARRSHLPVLERTPEDVAQRRMVATGHKLLRGLRDQEVEKRVVSR